MNTALTWLAALAIAFLLSASHLLPGPSEHSADWTDSEALKALQASEAGSARRDAAAAQLCREARGPNSEARWTVDGDLVCAAGSRHWPVQIVQTAQVQP